MNPSLSIGLPVYNAEQYLPSALDSLLTQTYRDFELIISDNGSTDATESICRRYAEADSRIRYVREDENHGAIWNFNRVFELAQGRYFKWAASDDLCAPTFLEKCVDVLDRDPDIAWVHPLTLHIDGRGEVIPPAEDPQVPDGESGHGFLHREKMPIRWSRADLHPHERFAAVLLGSTWCSDHFGVFRTEVLRQTRVILPYYGAEKIATGEVSLRGRFHEIPEVLFFQRLHPDNSVAMTCAKQQQRWVSTASSSLIASSTRLLLLRGHLVAALRAPVSLRERIRCLSMIARYIFQVQKWAAVIPQVFLGAAIRGTAAPDTRSSRSHAFPTR